MDGLVQFWKETVAGYNQNLFNGSAASVDTLWTMIGDGKLLEAEVVVEAGDAQHAVEHAIFGYMIPEAWSFPGNGYFPFVS